MTTVDREVSLDLPLTLSERDELGPLLAEVEAKARLLTETIGQARATLAEMRAGDPLAVFRIPSGAVGFETTYADKVKVGDWVQRCTGDPDWHQVDAIEPLWFATRCAIGDPDGRRLVYDGLAHDWKATDAIRVARPPAEVVARQERKWETGR